MWRRFAIVISILAWVVLSACSRQPTRPSNADPASVYVETVKTGFCEFCHYDAAKRIDHCKVVNERGDILYDEEFVPYDGGPPVPLAELVIVQGKFEQAVTLQNGRLLLPKSDYALIKRHIDWLQRKAPTY